MPMWAIAPVSATVWFWLFMLVIYLVMINMLLAIILDVYTKEKDESEGTETLWQQAASAAKEMIHRTHNKGDRVSVLDMLEAYDPMESPANTLTAKMEDTTTESEET